MDDRYEYKLPSRAGAWGLLVFASIIAAVDVYFWLPFYRACQALNHNVLEAIKTNVQSFALFAGIAAVYFIFSIIANVKFSRCSRFFGPSFGGILGRLLILIEYAAYAFAIIALFIA